VHERLTRPLLLNPEDLSTETVLVAHQTRELLVPQRPVPRQMDVDEFGAAKGLEKKVEDGAVESELEKLERSELARVESLEPVVEGQVGDVGEASQERTKEENGFL
jgi:hypothetical protein